LRNELNDWARSRLLETPKLNEWFKATAIQQMLDEHKTGRINHGKRLLALLMFTLWLEGNG
jgi:asparagine synthase (glutamine-hydrolysing)